MKTYKKLKKGETAHNHPLAPYTSWRIGGPADLCFIPKDLSHLEQFLRTQTGEQPITMLGLGSNVLIRDGGIRGIVIIIQGALNEMTLVDQHTIRAEAGRSCAQLARFAAKQDLVGGEFFAGIPGTIGGALKMNAGAFGGETWEKVICVETMDYQGNIHHRTRDEFEVTYRETQGLAKNEWFIAGTFVFDSGDGKESLQQIKFLLDKRAQTQPTGEPSCGSVFRNPQGDYAARLIESCELKGYRIGGAQVSEKHANFIINTGNASAKDIIQLITHVHDTVEAETGTNLEREVIFIGEYE